MKQAHIVKRRINPSIKLGDVVQIFNGFGLAPVKSCEMNFFLIFAYPKFTGSDERLGEIKGVVTEVSILDVITDANMHSNYCHGTDIKVKLGNREFYTCSGYVKKINTNSSSK